MKLEEEIKQQKFKDEYHRLLVNIMFTGSWLNIRQIHFFKQFDLSPQQYNLLRILRGQYPNPASVNLLIERMLDKQSNASRLVDKLDAKGLVKRKKCNEDKRQVEVVLSAKGVQLLDAIDKEIGNLDSIFTNLTKAEAKKMSEMLDKMRG